MGVWWSATSALLSQFGFLLWDEECCPIRSPSWLAGVPNSFGGGAICPIMGYNTDALNCGCAATTGRYFGLRQFLPFCSCATLLSNWFSQQHEQREVGQLSYPLYSLPIPSHPTRMPVIPVVLYPFAHSPPPSHRSWSWRRYDTIVLLTDCDLPFAGVSTTRRTDENCWASGYLYTQVSRNKGPKGMPVLLLGGQVLSPQ